MRASEVAERYESAINSIHVLGYVAGAPDILEQATLLRDLARCLVATQAAVEELAAMAGTGPARRIAAILDGVPAPQGPAPESVCACCGKADCVLHLRGVA